MLLKEFPWATTKTFLPARISLAIWSCQNGITLTTVSLRHSVSGKASLGTSAYLISLAGFLGSVGSNGGGGMS